MQLGGVLAGLLGERWVSELDGSEGVEGAFFGNPWQLVVQLIDIGASFSWSFVMTFLILSFMELIGMPIALSKEHQEAGADLIESGEFAYQHIQDLSRQSQSNKQHDPEKYFDVTSLNMALA
jgi:Amt family ammonium transporter